MKRLLIILGLMLALPACQELLTAFEIGQDPEVEAARAELLEQEGVLTEQRDRIAFLQDRLADEGLTVDTAQEVMVELRDAMQRYEEVAVVVANTKKTLEAEMGERGASWWQGLLGLLVGGMMPTMNSIPILGPLLSNKGVAKLLEKGGLRNESFRKVARTDGAPPPSRVA
jgi:hypothetical protein